MLYHSVNDVHVDIFKEKRVPCRGVFTRKLRPPILRIADDDDLLLKKQAMGLNYKFVLSHMLIFWDQNKIIL